MKKIHVNVPNHDYDIIIQKGILKFSAEYIRKISNASKIMVVTDENVAPLYADILKEALGSLYNVKIVVLPAGETTKSIDYLKQLYDEAFEFGMTRSDLMIALGGGVIGDLTGFCASTLLRGVDVVQIPTTILSQVDSSVGGKTAIDVPQGKNLVGTFYQPKLVLIDTETLKTLPDKEFSCGMAEVIKYGAIWDEKFFETLESTDKKTDLIKNIDDVVFTCCDIKRQVVEKDEHDTGIRMILNFGHTAGHVVEKAYNYTGYSHGEAVAFGMIIASKLGEKLGITPVGTSERIKKLAERYDLPTEIDMDKERLYDATLDKKAQGNTINVILLNKIGKCEICKMLVSEYVDECKSVWD